MSPRAVRCSEGSLLCLNRVAETQSSRNDLWLTPEVILLLQRFLPGEMKHHILPPEGTVSRQELRRLSSPGGQHAA